MPLPWDRNAEWPHNPLEINGGLTRRGIDTMTNERCKRKFIQTAGFFRFAKPQNSPPPRKNKLLTIIEDRKMPPAATYIKTDVSKPPAINT